MKKLLSLTLSLLFVTIAASFSWGSSLINTFVAVNGINVDFEVEGISSSDGKLVLKLKLYKGTNNNGCFYGLTGIVLKGLFDETTTATDIALDIEQQGRAFDLVGREVINPSKGVYIVDGVKRVLE